MTHVIHNMNHNTFIHIPKTAGSSAVEATQHNVYGHDTLRQHLGRNQDLGYIWSIVRNPYDRALSMYYFMRSRVERIVPLKDHDKHPYTLATSPSDYWCNHVKDFQVIGTFYMRPQSWFLCDSYMPITQPRSIPHIYESKPEPGSISISSKIDQILRFESLQDDWEILKASIDCDDLPYINKTDTRPDKHWSDELCDESIARIGELYADDFDCLGYDKLA